MGSCRHWKVVGSFGRPRKFVCQYQVNFSDLESSVHRLCQREVTRTKQQVEWTGEILHCVINKFTSTNTYKPPINDYQRDNLIFGWRVFRIFLRDSPRRRAEEGVTHTKVGVLFSGVKGSIEDGKSLRCFACRGERVFSVPGSVFEKGVIPGTERRGCFVRGWGVTSAGFDAGFLVRDLPLFCTAARFGDFVLSSSFNGKAVGGAFTVHSSSLRSSFLLLDVFRISGPSIIKSSSSDP